MSLVSTATAQTNRPLSKAIMEYALRARWCWFLVNRSCYELLDTHRGLFQASVEKKSTKKNYIRKVGLCTF